MIRRESKRRSRTEAAGRMDSSTLPGASKIYRRKSRRHMTCPNPREINQALACISLGELNRSCTLEELIEKCLRSFDIDGKLCTSDFMVNMTLTVHSWVVPSAELARRLLTLYQESAQDKNPSRQLRICHFVRYWLVNYPEAFHLDPHLEEVITEILEVVRSQGPAGHNNMLDTSCIKPVEKPVGKVENCFALLKNFLSSPAYMGSGEESCGGLGKVHSGHGDSVFKNYDPDQRGCISQEDFETISMSFPFSFYGLEREREGTCNRDDLSEYFMRACAIFSKLGLMVLHDFQEVTFKKPTFCDHCGGFLWGVSKQGYRCRDCAMICHKHCKNQVEVECHTRRFPSSSSSSDSTPRTSTAMLAMSHHPSSGSEEEMFLFPPGWEQGKSPVVSLSSSPGSRMVKHASTQTDQASPATEDREQLAEDCNKTQKQLMALVKELEKERDRLLTANQSLQNRYTQLEAENRRLLKTGSPASLYEIAPRFI
ncbi:RAS guanyl-releasing protein 4 [Notechis scutatus]|uniref:RAS guanyl-releasing protein 4 n=1 Tax=Notechis scutatus TaxID=8663 RepID=A0A6J1VW75_9SAUR|nr:RAS guanyl-releasing protein 4 [Notechis scutatus]